MEAYIATLKKVATGGMVNIEVTADDITKVKDKFVIEEYDPEYVLVNVRLKKAIGEVL
jgi:hypothetical protein